MKYEEDKKYRCVDIGWSCNQKFFTVGRIYECGHSSDSLFAAKKADSGHRQVTETARFELIEDKKMIYHVIKGSSIVYTSNSLDDATSRAQDMAQRTPKHTMTVVQALLALEYISNQPVVTYEMKVTDLT